MEEKIGYSHIKSIVKEALTAQFLQTPQRVLQGSILILLTDCTEKTKPLLENVCRRYDGLPLYFGLLGSMPVELPESAGTFLSLSEPAAREALVNSADSFKQVCFLTPGLATLRHITEIQSDGFLEKLTACRLIHNKPVEAVLDFKPADIVSAPLSGTVTELIQSLEALGITVSGGEAGPRTQPEPQENTFINAQTVETAKKQGLNVLIKSRRAVVTPLALERAKDLKITIKTT